MLSSFYDKLLYALAVLDFSTRRSVPVHHFHSTERYGSYAHCNGTWYMSTRLLPLVLIPQGAAEMRSLFHYALRRRGDREGVVHQVSAHRMAHNLALSCEGNALYAYGGTDSRNGKKSELMGEHDGIYRARVDVRTGALQAPQRVLTGKHPGCVERRLGFGGVCEFDGKFSVVQFKGRTWLYARANTVTYHGGRHVQVASVPSSSSSASSSASAAYDESKWSDFSLLHVDGVASGVASNNIYFFVANAWNATHLVGTYPAVLADGRSGVFASYSSDGVRWSRPETVVDSRAFGQRVEKFPVGVRDGRVHVMHVNLLLNDMRSPHDVALWSYPLRKTSRDEEDDGVRVTDFDVDRLRLVN